MARNLGIFSQITLRRNSSGFRRRGNDGNLCQILRSAGLHRGSPPSESGGSRNARFYWVFRTSRLGGGEGGIRTPVILPSPTDFGSHARRRLRRVNQLYVVPLQRRSNAEAPTEDFQRALAPYGLHNVVTFCRRTCAARTYGPQDPRRPPPSVSRDLPRAQSLLPPPDARAG
jgi:hypothetical protein